MTRRFLENEVRRLDKFDLTFSGFILFLRVESSQSQSYHLSRREFCACPFEPRVLIFVCNAEGPSSASLCFNTIFISIQFSKVSQNDVFARRIISRENKNYRAQSAVDTFANVICLEEVKSVTSLWSGPQRFFKAKPSLSQLLV